MMELERVSGLQGFTWFLLFGFTVSLSLGTFWESTFQKVTTHSNFQMRSLNLSWTNEDLMGCATHCLKLKDSCYSFTYDVKTTVCVLGSWLLPADTSTSVATGDVYYTGAFCNTDANFTLLTFGNTTYCLYFALDKFNYTSASQACLARHSHLYTLKEPVKLDVLKTFLVNTNDSWVGLDDRAEEGVFRWLDDKTLLTSEMKSFLFTGVQPDNAGDKEDCVQYDTYRYPLNDRDCSYTSPFVCEVTPLTGL
ncbi:unnamed protein product [Lymnaea stagnalis]|uniref:C-type lectin domain-containing protein n=1 Tax=Lymnaea stagnalis TaxID=6523 RepID=A0AAV2I428_LYMST